MMEYNPKYTPGQKGVIIPLLYEAFDHAESAGAPPVNVNSQEMLWVLSYIEYMRECNTFKDFRDMTLAVISAEDTGEALTESDTRKFSSMLCRSISHLYSSALGKEYFGRVANVMESSTRVVLKRVMSTLFESIPKGKEKIQVLDVGCGDGRFMHYMHQNYERIHIQGVDNSPLPYSLCKQKEESNRLPKGSVKMGDVRQLPYEDGSFDFLFFRSVLHDLPYFKHSEAGAGEAFAELARVLKPGGFCYIDVCYGNYREYFPKLRQTYTHNDMCDLCEKYGFEIVWEYSKDRPEQCPELNVDMSYAHPRYQDSLRVFLKKVS